MNPDRRPFLCLALTLCVAALLGSRGLSAAEPSAYELALVDLKGNRKILGTLPNSVFAPRVSPDGRRVAFEADDPAATTTRQPVVLWVADLQHLDQRRALPRVGTGANWAPVWSNDGQHLAFDVSTPGLDALYWRRADGTGEAEHLIDARAVEGLYAGDTQLAFITLTGNRDYGIWMLDLRTRAATLLVDYPKSEQHSSRLSPDRRWIAYVSNETGRQEVWLEPLPQTGKRYRVTQNGGRHPEWSPDGATLYFDTEGQMFRVPFFSGAEIPKVGEPQGLPIKGFQQGDLRRQYDLMPDGKRFVMLFPVQ